ncbi:MULTISPECIES: hypothetical protein [Oceanobacillus]|uniref:hypothetical protein n=1 Tax=Oceanobacillus TaxID=182709 RepID=UPI0009BA7AE1|nr:hypothetical protein [Oceanobacillus timonensis]
MDLVIRNINPTILGEYSEKAKKVGKSRQEYLKDMIESYSILNNINDREREYKNQLELNSQLMMELKKSLDRNNSLLELLMEDD